MSASKAPVPAEPKTIEGVEIASDRHNTFSDGQVSIPEGSWPGVEFKDGSKLLVPRVEIQVVGAEGGVIASRQQVPLILAYAIVACQNIRKDSFCSQANMGLCRSLPCVHQGKICSGLEVLLHVQLLHILPTRLSGALVAYCIMY